MIQYTYKARDINGKIFRDKIELGSDAEFYKYLEEKNLYCISREIVNLDDVQAGKKNKKMKLQLLSLFCRELSVLLASGMNLMTALQLLHEREEKKEIKAHYMRMIERIEKGDTLYEAMKKQGNFFPDLLKAMILAGESSGSLDAVIDKMALYYEKEAALKAKVQNAMIYPVILIGVTVAVIIILFTFVLPNFFKLFEGQKIPGITKAFMGISRFMTEHWLILLLAAVLLVLLGKAALKNEKAAYEADRLVLSIPVFGKLFETIIMAHFANAMSILYASGVTIIKALEISSGTIRNKYIALKLVGVRERVEKGEALSQALRSEEMFDRMFWSMVHIGEESGNLETMFFKLSEYLEHDSETAVQKMMAVLEPAVLIFIAVIIGSVVASVLLPIYSMYQIQ